MEEHKRIQVNISEEGVKEIEELRKTLNLGSVADVIRSSLKFMKYVELERNAGNEIIVRDRKTNREKQVVFIH